MGAERIRQLQAAIAALEAQRAMLGDQVADTAIAPLKQQLAALRAQSEPSAPGVHERRLLTILFADMVGSTSIAENLDPEEWHRIIYRLHAALTDIINTHGGMVSHYLGDGLLALFGAQQVSECDPENAVRAALHIQQEIADWKLETDASPQLAARIPPLRFRVGIHTGLVFTGEIGSGERREFSPAGDAMNLASRLEAAAPPGGILISHETYMQVRGVFDLTPQPMLRVKGRSESIQTYIVHRAKSHPFRVASRGVAGVRTPTVGRASDLQALRDAYCDARQNRRTVWVQLVGEAGVGKSRLLNDTNDWIDLQPEWVWALHGGAFAGDQAHPYALVRRLWFECFHIPEGMPVADAEKKWVDEFQKLSGITELEAAQALGLLVGLPFKDSPSLTAFRNDPALVQARARVVSRAVFRHLRRDSLVALFLENLHWADASSWEWLTQVILTPDQESETRADELQGIFVLVSARPEWQPPEALMQAAHRPQPSADSPVQVRLPAVQYTELYVPPLTDEATRQLVHELLRRVADVPEEIVEQVAQRAEGVPYYAEELVNWFIDRGIIDTRSNSWCFVPERLKGSPMPTTLQHLLLTRLWALSESERNALQRASVLGRHFWSGGVDALGVQNSAAVFESLQVRGMVLSHESTLPGESEWSFHHSLLRDVTYESVLKRERPHLHRAAAEWLECQAERAGRVDEFAGWIGEHWEHAGYPDRAADWYLRAAAQAWGASATTEARRFWDRALEMIPADDRERRWQALLGREAALNRHGDRQAQKADIDALLDLAAEMGDDYIARANFCLEQYRGAQGDHRGALEIVDITLAAARRAGNVDIEARALSDKVYALTRLGRMSAARQLVDEVLRWANELQDPLARAHVLGNVALHLIEAGNLARAIPLNVECAETSQRYGDLQLATVSLGNLGYSYIQLGLFAEARQTLEHAMAIAERIGERRFRTYALMNLGLALWRAGETEAARQKSNQALAEFIGLNDLYGRCGCLIDLAYMAEQAGDHSEAARYFGSIRETASTTGTRGWATEALAGLARCARAGDRPAQSDQLAEEVWNYLRTEGTGGMEMPAIVYTTVVDIFAATGRARDARQAVEMGYRELMQQVDKISDERWRKSFLQNIPENRTLVERWQALNTR